MPSTPPPPGPPAPAEADLDHTQRVEITPRPEARRPARRPPPPPVRPALAWPTLLATLLLFATAGLGALSLYLASSAREAARRADALDDELITVRALLTEAEARAERAQLDRDAAQAAAGRGATPRAAALVELGPERAIGEGGAAEIELDLGNHRPPTTLLLRLGRRPAEAVYRIEILDLRGERVWRSGTLRREVGDRFVVVLPGGSLGLGRHELRLLGGRAGEERLLAAWYLQVLAGP